MMTKEQLAAFHDNRHEETNILKQELTKAEYYSGELSHNELSAIVVDPRGKGKNRAYRRKLAAVTRQQQKINRKR